MPFKIVRNDLTKMQVDAIVNTANSQPIYSSGTDLAVYKAAGEEELLKARKVIGVMEEGEVAMTPGFKLPAKYIIHAVSPRYVDGHENEEEKLRSCYRKSLALAAEHQLESIAFPLIATGSFRYPKEEGMRIALDEINAFLMTHNMMVYLVVFDTKATQLGLNVYPNLEAYIDHHYVCEKREEEYGDRYFGSIPRNHSDYSVHRIERAQMEEALRPMPKAVPRAQMSRRAPEAPLPSEARVEFDACCESNESYAFQNDYDAFVELKESALKERMKHLTDTFQEYMMYLIDLKNLSNVDVYKRAFLNKKLFSKIKQNPQYHPDKGTALRLCVGLMLNLDETKDLLARAGYALSPCDKRDIIFSYFIEYGIYDMIEIDLSLEEHGLPGCLG